nr:response regulator [candidate division KSB1 bacterium]NIS23969.1 response regulator [candidate division KSB1 bacterium]NIT72495.1 response regulator [candidate division KSB1 bacterium]NIU26272.1 response regulator [candidate division KSB1 bacterium]NIU89238.1 response regulator [candidate division KSB1 bacterium]
EADKMEKVFYNLLSNAFKFTPEEGKVEVEVSVAEREGETEKRRNGEEKPPALNVTDSPFLPFPDSSDSRTAQYVQIRISDTGPGIRADQLPHIFDRFYQADDFYYEETLPRGGRHATFQQGTGIGLALSKELVELHGGQIFVASKEGAGTEFTVCLPISSEAGKRKPETGIPYIEVTQSRKAPDVELQPGESQNSPEPSLPVSHEVVLIVEDNHDVRAYIREQLESEYQLIEAANGSEGIEQAQATIPDLIITDVMMPGMDGYEFSKRIRSDEKTSHIPIIMLTAKAALDDRIEGLETGADAYLTKPFSTKELTVQVRNLILQRRELRKRFSRATVLNPLEVAGSSVDQVFLKKVISSIEEHFEDQQLCVERLAETVNMSVSQLNRKLRALIDQPAGQLIRSMRLQRAADLLKRNAGTVAEICYKVGFSDQANFTRAFKKQFGVAPGEFRRRE